MIKVFFKSYLDWLIPLNVTSYNTSFPDRSSLAGDVQYGRIMCVLPTPPASFEYGSEKHQVSRGTGNLKEGGI